MDLVSFNRAERCLLWLSLKQWSPHNLEKMHLWTRLHTSIIELMNSWTQSKDLTPLPWRSPAGLTTILKLFVLRVKCQRINLWLCWPLTTVQKLLILRVNCQQITFMIVLISYNNPKTAGVESKLSMDNIYDCVDLFA